ncbi:MAG: hypothetical protein JST93_22775 [Acidobacteria bacterium]|nr:hypothetical protein [Acidobacteriota bacterium]
MASTLYPGFSRLPQSSSSRQSPTCQKNYMNNSNFFNIHIQKSLKIGISHHPHPLHSKPEEIIMPLTRTEQSRLNGSKSVGPTTEQGRARSALNRTSHGMFSCRVVLETESQKNFQIFAGLYHDLFDPQDQFEADLVDSLVHARWKIRRLESAHSAELNLTITEHRAEIDDKYGENASSDQLHALAYRYSSKHLETLDKHLERQERLFSRTYRNLAKHRRNQPIPAIEDLAGIEEEIPSNTQNERFEPETPAEPAPQAPEPQPEPQKPPQNQPSGPSGPNPFQKIAIIIVLLLASISSSFSGHAVPMPERSDLTYASL